MFYKGEIKMNESIIDGMVDFLEKTLENDQKRITGDVDYIQGYFIGEIATIKYVLDCIKFAKGEVRK